MKSPKWKMACVAALLGSVLSSQPASAKVCGGFDDPYTIKVNQVGGDRFTFQFCHFNNHGEVCEAIGKGPYTRDQLKSYARWSRAKAAGAVVGDGAVIVGTAAAGWFLGKLLGPGAGSNPISDTFNNMERLLLQVGLGVAGTAGGIAIDATQDVLNPSYYWQRAALLSSEEVLLSGDKCVNLADHKYIHPLAESLQRMLSTGNDVAERAPSSSYGRAETNLRDNGNSTDAGTPATFGHAGGASAP